MAKPGIDQIKSAAQQAGLKLSDEEVGQLAAHKPVPISTDKVQASGGCSAIKIIDLVHGYGLYFIPFPPTINFCCET